MFQIGQIDPRILAPLLVVEPVNARDVVGATDVALKAPCLDVSHANAVELNLFKTKTLKNKFGVQDL